MKLKILKRIIFYSLIYVFAGLILFCYQRKFLYFPTDKISHNFDNETFANEGETIEVIVLNRGKKEALIYFGGNAESVIYNAGDFQKMLPEHTVYLFNYRGYGGSTGKPEEKGIYSDALCLFDRVEKKHSAISVIGRSLGSGVATFLATRRKIEKLILVTPYDSIKNVAQKKLIIYPMFILLKDKYDSINRVEKITAKTLVVIAENDNVIPNKHSLRLVRKFPVGQITIKTITGTDHNNISEKEEYYHYLKIFLKADEK